MTNADTFEARWAQFTANTAKANSLNKGIVFAALAEAGMTNVTVTFDGEGDSGQIAEVIALAGEQLVAWPATKLTLYGARSGENELYTREVTLREAVEELCYRYLEQDYGGWENNDGAFGEFSFSVAERRIDLEFNARFTSYEAHNQTF